MNKHRNRIWKVIGMVVKSIFVFLYMCFYIFFNVCVREKRYVYVSSKSINKKEYKKHNLECLKSIYCMFFFPLQDNRMHPWDLPSFMSNLIPLFTLSVENLSHCHARQRETHGLRKALHSGKMAQWQKFLIISFPPYNSVI